MPDIRSSTNSLVERMFIATADENYILARWAAIRHLDLDFLWLGLHAIEKYLKALLLLNGKPAQDYRHNVERLYRDVLRFNPSIRFESFVKPSFLQDTDNIHWIEDSVESYIRRLNQMGDPNNRYMLYGFSVWSDDLFKLDQMVWKIRRHCRPLKQLIREGTPKIEIDWVEELRKQPMEWKLGGNLPIEEVFDEKRSREVSDALLTLNSAFAPTRTHDYIGWRTSSSMSPLTDWLQLLQNQRTPEEVRQTVELKLKWALENLDFNKNDKRDIETAIARYQSNVGRNA